MKDCLHLFNTETAEWFQKTFKIPTAVQEAAWSAIAAGGHVLVSAPTGTGKTLSAFLVFLDKLKRQAVEGTLKPELQLIYVSPLKSLAADIRENLRKPLAGIGGEELVKVAIRTGDTSQKERRQMIRKPPHILIITPESLYLMLTSKTGQNILCTANALIIDELHALMDTKRGASFMQALNGILPKESPYDTLLSLLEKGIVTADSFVPVRQWLEKDRIKKTSAKRRVGAHIKALGAGRWDLVHHLKPLTIKEQMKQCFDRYFIMCRETALAYGMSWQEALSILRVQEYTGQVRRGYFVKGLSGTQFIRRNDFEGITSFLRTPTEDMFWINVSDPMQPWGKLFQHEAGRSFINVKGTTAAFRKGLPIVLFEKYGNTLRIFETDIDCLKECLNMFSKEYKNGRIFAGRKRIIVKKYPDIAVDALSKSGFIREMKDYVLYK